MLKVVTLFSGGGGVEAGLKDVFGELEGYAVEFNPKNPKHSSAIADCYQKNFPDHTLFRKTVKEMADNNFADLPQNPDILWASPECVYSSILRRHQQTDKDEEDFQAIFTMSAVYRLQPRHFILENVPSYSDGQAFRVLVLQNLRALGYTYNFKIVRTLTHQSRDRLILWASKGELLPPPQDAILGGWWWKISGLVEDLPDTDLSPSQQKFSFVEAPTWINCVGRGNKPTPGNKPVPAITKSQFTDGKGANRDRFAVIVLPDGKVKQVSIECVKRLQGFPGWYQLPKETAIAGAILGNSVPPEFVKNWLSSREALTTLGVSHKENPIKEFSSQNPCDTPTKEFAKNNFCDPCDTPGNASGWISYDHLKKRYLYNYRERRGDDWRYKCKHVKKELLQIVQEMRSRKKSVKEILRIL